MKLLMNPLKGCYLLLLFTFFITSCGEDPAVTITPTTPSAETTGKVNIEITDAPSDDPNIKGIFVAIAEVKVDGKTFDGFKGKTTIELSAYHSGKTEVLGLSELKTDTYNNITLVLDYETDANGNSPGCYALTKDDQKENLATSNTNKAELTISNQFEAQENETIDLIIDFDLRKAVESEDGDNYRFVAESDLKASLRLVKKSETGNIKGSCDKDYDNSDKIVVYAYAKGNYSQSETQGTTKFKKAVTSTEVADDNGFTLSFLEGGDYELIFASYKDDNADGRLELKSQLTTNLLLNLESNVVSVSAQTDISIDIEFTGILNIGG